MKLNVVLVEPEIPQNTGNIARTCAAIGAKLHLVKPLGFSISEKQVKRAGLDYWDKLDIEDSGMEEVFVLFGKETKGLPEDTLKKYIEKTARIPMRPTLRSLNLSNSVAIVVYEILRQKNFEELQEVSDYLIWNQEKMLKCFHIYDKIFLIGELYYTNGKDG